MKSGRSGIRTHAVQKEGCAERIAPIGTLSQNGYGEDIETHKRSMGTPDVTRDFVENWRRIYRTNQNHSNLALKFRNRKNGRSGIRTHAAQKEGCAERIAPIGTLSQNGYGEDMETHKRSMGTPDVTRDFLSKRHVYHTRIKIIQIVHKNSEIKKKKWSQWDSNPRGAKGGLRRAHRPDWYLEPKWLR